MRMVASWVANNDRVYGNFTDDAPAPIVFVDGGCSGNDQRDLTKRRMVAAVSDDRGQILVERSRDGGSNNIAELWAVVEALEWAAGLNQPTVEIRTDSKNNFAWVFWPKLGQRLNDRAAVEALHVRLHAVRQRVAFRLVWVPREENKAGQYLEQSYGV